MGDLASPATCRIKGFYNIFEKNPSNHPNLVMSETDMEVPSTWGWAPVPWIGHRLHQVFIPACNWLHVHTANSMLIYKQDSHKSQRGKKILLCVRGDLSQILVARQRSKPIQRSDDSLHSHSQKLFRNKDGKPIPRKITQISCWVWWRFLPSTCAKIKMSANNSKANLTRSSGKSQRYYTTFCESTYGAENCSDAMSPLSSFQGSSELTHIYIICSMDSHRMQFIKHSKSIYFFNKTVLCSHMPKEGEDDSLCPQPPFWVPNWLTLRLSSQESSSWALGFSCWAIRHKRPLLESCPAHPGLPSAVSSLSPHGQG